MTGQLAHHQYEQALAALGAESSPIEKVEMLMEIAMGLQMKPKNLQQLFDAVALYERAIELCPSEENLLKARIRARRATALQVIPGESTEYLEIAQLELVEALKELEPAGIAEEVAEIQMNLGLIAQSLFPFGKARITEAIDWYQKALRVFNRENYATEYAILHNNLATAFLSIPASDERAKIREALAVQSFESALEVITIEDNPSEYAMLQNNLGNALQYVSSSHALENNLRALAAYDQALRVRTKRTTPLLYATTIANKANCLCNFGEKEKLEEALELCRSAHKIFISQDQGNIQVLSDRIAEIEAELGLNPTNTKDLKAPANNHEFGTDRAK